MAGKKSERDERLARRLRENLKRRKAQARHLVRASQQRPPRAEKPD